MAANFQEVINRANAISINKRPEVGQSITRGNVVRSINRGGDLWRFEVQLPNGIPWTELRQTIQFMENAGRHTASQINLNVAGTASWFMNYQGDSASTTGFTYSYVSGNTIEITAYPGAHGLTGGDITFKRGDLIGLALHNYTVANDVVYPNTTITLNRPGLEAGSSTGNISVGPNQDFTVVCAEMPDWTIFDRNQVSWSGPFVFYEYIA